MINKKQNLLKYVKIIFNAFAIVAIILFIFNEIDNLSHGIITDWFDRQFSYEMSYRENGKDFIIKSYDWESMKYFALKIIVPVSFIIIIIFSVISENKKQNYIQECSNKTTAYLKKYIIENEPLPAEIPEDTEVIFSRITEIKYDLSEKEKLIRTETKRKTDLMIYLAHDLKTPLTSIIGYLSLIQSETNISDKSREKYIDIVMNNSLRLEELINELFETARFDITTIELQTERVNISVMLEQIAYEFIPVLNEKSLTFHVSIEPDIFMLCDINKMERIIDNIIRNAIAYSYENSVIFIELKKVKNELILSFKNSGRNIPAEKLERIFEQFYRLDYSRNSATGGSGLGLAIARQLTEAHGGTIHAESHDEAVIFTLRFPL